MQWLFAVIFTVSLSAQAKEKVVEVVRNFTRVKILQSNNVGLRPGSIYDNITIFESLLEFPKPGFNYEFVDSGLGAAEPLYPMFQKGHQGSWAQLIPAFFSQKQRHIDHYTSMTTPEGCLVQGLYGLRHISEYPKNVFQKERAEGYEQIVVRLEHYTRIRPGAQCGRHYSEDPDPTFKPMAFVKKYHKAMTFADFPQNILHRFEWKLSAIHHISEERNKHKWPRFDLEKLKQNSLWYYPNGHSEDYGVNQPRPQPGLIALQFAKHLFIEGTEDLQREWPLRKLLSEVDFGKVMDFLNGRPTTDFNPEKEPGHDVLKLSDVSEANIYTSGLYLEKITDVVHDVSDMNNYALVGITIKPYEAQDDAHWDGLKVIPQLRFVYQLMDPRAAGRPFEQLYYHLKYDVVDRHADQSTRDLQHQQFLRRLDELVKTREDKDPDYPQVLAQFIHDFTDRPIESISFSSSLTGIWTFGALTRSLSSDLSLQALRIIREGVDLGYYSSTYDSDLFRSAIKHSTGEQQQKLQQLMADLTPTVYRDPKRLDTQAIRFDRVSCAQCHQTSGRDGVHVSLNDGLDRRITSFSRPSEYFFHEADRQLKIGSKFWHKN